MNLFKTKYNAADYSEQRAVYTEPYFVVYFKILLKKQKCTFSANQHEHMFHVQ